MAGFVYIMTNPAMPGLVKIGKSSKDPREFRVVELQTTGVPKPFIVEYDVFVKRYSELEREVHVHLSKVRVGDDREFFECTVITAIEAIKKIVKNSELILERNTYAEYIAEVERKSRLEKERKEFEERAQSYRSALLLRERKAREAETHRLAEEARQVAEEKLRYENARRATEEKTREENARREEEGKFRRVSEENFRRVSEENARRVSDERTRRLIKKSVLNQPNVITVRLASKQDRLNREEMARRQESLAKSRVNEEEKLQSRIRDYREETLNESDSEKKLLRETEGRACRDSSESELGDELLAKEQLPEDENSFQARVRDYKKQKLSEPLTNPSKKRRKSWRLYRSKKQLLHVESNTYFSEGAYWRDQSSAISGYRVNHSKYPFAWDEDIEDLP